MKSNFFLTIGLMLVVLFGGLSAVMSPLPEQQVVKEDVSSSR